MRILLIISLCFLISTNLYSDEDSLDSWQKNHHAAYMEILSYNYQSFSAFYEYGYALNWNAGPTYLTKIKAHLGYGNSIFNFGGSYAFSGGVLFSLGLDYLGLNNSIDLGLHYSDARVSKDEYITVLDYNGNEIFDYNVWSSTLVYRHYDDGLTYAIGGSYSYRVESREYRLLLLFRFGYEFEI